MELKILCEKSKVYKSVNDVSFVYTEPNDREKGWQCVGGQGGEKIYIKLYPFVPFKFYYCTCISHQENNLFKKNRAKKKPFI